MATYSNNEILSVANGTCNEAKFYVICPVDGAIIVISNLTTATMVSYRKQNNGKYAIERELTWTSAAEKPLLAMLDAHNASDYCQEQAAKFAKEFGYNF